MQDGMQHDPIQGQGQGHEPLKVGNSTIFKDSPFPFITGAGLQFRRITVQELCLLVICGIERFPSSHFYRVPLFY